MTLEEILLEVWKQTLVDGEARVEMGPELSVSVRRTRNQGLRTVTFQFEGRPIDGIEQNPETKSAWARMAREGKRIMQFSCEGRYVGNVSEGHLTRYPAWKAKGLPE